MGFEPHEAVVRRGEPIEGLDAPLSLVGGLFDLDVDAITEPTTVREGWAVIGVTGEVPSAVAPLDEVRSELHTAVLNDRALTSAREVATRALEQHGSVEEVARALGIEVRQSGAVTSDRTLPGTGGMGSELREALFSDGAVEGTIDVVAAPAGAVVFEITRREVFDPEKFEESKDGLRQVLLTQRRDAMVGAALEALRADYEIEINDEIVNRIDA
jgi:hypothetical protein